MDQNIPFEKWTHNIFLIDWIKDKVKLCKPNSLHLCDGSEKEYQELSSWMIEEKKGVSLNPKLRPNSLWFHSHPDDVARVEEVTFICSKKKEDAGPTNNWKEPQEMKDRLLTLFSGCMEGRTMYVIPFNMGPIGSKLGHTGVQITDSPYVVCNMKIMTRMGNPVLKILKNDFVPCMHSVGVPLKPGQKDVSWPSNPQNRCVVHFPEERSIWSFGSGYGGNALLGKKCFALRIASVMARDDGWLAEHMLILGITNPKGEKKYMAAAFPSACGKTNLAMLTPTLPGWKIECVGDDIAWMRLGEDGRLYAINPESGFFGVATGTSEKTNHNAMASIKKNTIFTNVALTKDKDVWWEGMTSQIPEGLTDWYGNPYDPSSGKPAAHPNSRFTAPASQCPIIDPLWEDPKGVPISAIIFGGRRGSTIPLVYQSFSWQHGTFLGASVSSETTAAAKGEIGKLRHDPFAMLPFCGYNMGDYFAHWLSLGEKNPANKLPLIFYVNWFLKDENNRYVWPGFGENIRVLKWMFERASGIDNAEKTPIGYIPKKNALDVSGLSLSDQDLKRLFLVDKEAWKKEVAELQQYFSIFSTHLPQGIKEELKALSSRL